MAVICEAEAEACSKKALMDQETAVLRQRLAQQEAEAQRLRQELFRRQQLLKVPDPPLGFDSELQAPENEESDLEEEAQHMQTNFDQKKAQPLFHELQEVKKKIMNLGRQLEHEREATARLEQERRRIVGYDPFVEAYQTSSSLQRELHRELKSTTRSLTEVMDEYHQQWSSLTAQVDILETYASVYEREAAGSHPSSPTFSSPPWSASLSNGALQTATNNSTDPLLSTRGSRGGKPRQARQRGRASPSTPQTYENRGPDNIEEHSASPSRPREMEVQRKERSPHRRSPSPSKAGDDIDQLWCRALRRFPEREDWVLVKERPGVYRLGHPGGRAIHSRVSHAGLQVRVGGGWQNAEAFLRRIGNAAIPPAGMSAAEFISGHGVDKGKPRTSGTATLPTGRVLSPTKSWASRIGIPKTPDFRSQRRIVESSSVECLDGGSVTAANIGVQSDAEPDQRAPSFAYRTPPEQALDAVAERENSNLPHRPLAPVTAATGSTTVLGSTVAQANATVPIQSRVVATTFAPNVPPHLSGESSGRSAATMSPRLLSATPPVATVTNVSGSTTLPLSRQQSLLAPVQASSPRISGILPDSVMPQMRVVRPVTAAASYSGPPPSQSSVSAFAPPARSWTPSRGSSLTRAASASWAPPVQATAQVASDNPPSQLFLV